MADQTETTADEPAFAPGQRWRPRNGGLLVAAVVLSAFLAYGHRPWIERAGREADVVKAGAELQVVRCCQVNRIPVSGSAIDIDALLRSHDRAPLFRRIGADNLLDFLLWGKGKEVLLGAGKTCHVDGSAASYGSGRTRHNPVYAFGALVLSVIGLAVMALNMWRAVHVWLAVGGWAVAVVAGAITFYIALGWIAPLEFGAHWVVSLSLSTPPSSYSLRLTCRPAVTRSEGGEA